MLAAKNTKSKYKDDLLGIVVEQASSSNNNIHNECRQDQAK